MKLISVEDLSLVTMLAPMKKFDVHLFLRPCHSMISLTMADFKLWLFVTNMTTILESYNSDCLIAYSLFSYLQNKGMVMVVLIK